MQSRFAGDTDPADTAKRTVQQRDCAFISLVCRSEDQVEKRFQSRKGREKEQWSKQGQICSMLTGQAGGKKEKDQGKAMKIVINQLLL